MDPNFIARLEREARAKQGLSPPAADVDHSIHIPPLSSESNQSDPIGSHLHQAQDHDDTELEYVDWDEDEALRVIGEVQEEVDDHPPSPTHLDSIGPQPRPSTSHEPSDDRDPDPPNEEAEDDDDDGTTDSDQDEIRPKKPDPIPTIRLTLALDLQLPLEYVVSLNFT
jgi:hypothetical protein